MSKLEKNNRFLRVFTLFCFVYNFGIYPLPQAIRTTSLVTFFLIIATLLKDRKLLILLPKEIGYVLLSFIFSFGIAVAVMFGGGSPLDTSFILPLFLMILTMYGSYLFILKFYKHLKITDFIRDIVLVTFIQSIIVIVMTLVPSIGSIVKTVTQTQTLSYFDNLGVNLESFGQGFRGNGVSGALFWDFGLQQSLGVICLAWLIKTTKFKFYYVISFLSIFISVLLASRTGLLGVLVAFIILFLPISRYIKVERETKYPVFSFLIINALLITPVIFLVDWDAVSDIVNFAFEFIISYIQTGSASSVSTSHLTSEMLFFPPIETIIFGDGRYMATDGIGYYANSDSGYIRMLYYWGLYSFVYYTIFVYIGYLTSKYCKVPLLSTVIVLIWSLMFIVQVKENLFLSSYQCLSVLFLLFSIVLINRNTPSVHL